MSAKYPLVSDSGLVRELLASTTLQTNASSSGAASLNLPQGAAPSAPVNGDCWTTSAGIFVRIGGVTIGPLNIGTVTSVGLSLPADFTVSGSPVTGAGTLTGVWANESANLVHAGPASGSAAVPTWRALVAADLPLATSSAFGAVKPDNSTITISGGVISSAAGGTVTTTGSPANGNLTKFSGPTSITNGDLSGDVTTGGALVTTIKNDVGLAGNPTTTTQAATDNSTRIATTAYVTTGIANAIAGVNPAQSVSAATTSAANTSGMTYSNGVGGIGATLTGSVNTPITWDGFTFNALGQRALVKNDTQSPSGAFNGVYYVTQLQTSLLPPILTRALDYDMPSDINSTGAIPVINGTVNALTSWLLTSTVTTVGTSPLTYVQFSFANNGTVTSVGLALPADFNVSGSPVTGSGTLTGAWANESANVVHAGPASGGAAAPTWRALVGADLPLATSSAFGAVEPDNTSITISAGVISASGSGGGATGAIDSMCFGDGSDGDVTVSTSITLSRDMYYHNLTLSGSAAIATSSYRIFVSGTLDISAAPTGSITNNGGNGVSTTAGSGTSNLFSVGGTGGAGGNGAAGTTGAGAQGSVGTSSTSGVGGNSGGSGAGGASGGGTSGGATRGGNTVTPIIDVRRLQSELFQWNNNGVLLIKGGQGAPGGSAGGGDGTGSGGSGGGGGGGGAVIYLMARTIARGTNTNASIIQAAGGNGAAGVTPAGGTNPGGGGGGSGGGGGWIYLCFRTLTGSTITNALDASGGNGGAGGNGKSTGVGGDGGAAGGGGRIDVYNLGAGTQSITGKSAAVAGNAHSGSTGGGTQTNAQKVNL